MSRSQPGQRLVDRPDLVQHRLVVRHVLVARAVVALVGDADFSSANGASTSSLVIASSVQRVEPHRVPQHHRVEPARAAAAAGVGAELVAALDEQVADRVAVEQLGRERAAADTRACTPWRRR